jgi:hypothetical protein
LAEILQKAYLPTFHFALPEILQHLFFPLVIFIGLLFAKQLNLNGLPPKQCSSTKQHEDQNQPFFELAEKPADTTRFLNPLTP